MPKRLPKTMASFQRNHQSIIIKPIQQAKIIRSASQNLRLQASDGHPQASDGHQKPADVHPKLMNGDFARLYGDSSHGSGIKFEGRWESCQMGFVASLWDFISGYAIAPSQSPDEESLPFSAVRRRSLRCYNRSKFGLLQQNDSVRVLRHCCYNRSKFGLLQQRSMGRT